jgi:hypothetical protein
MTEIDWSRLCSRTAREIIKAAWQRGKSMACQS